MLKRTTATRLCRSTRHPDPAWNMFTLHGDVPTPDTEVPGGAGGRPIFHAIGPIDERNRSIVTCPAYFKGGAK
jgi:hypothetical protein